MLRMNKRRNYYLSLMILLAIVVIAGWAIVLLTPTDRTRHYQLIGILATISSALFIIAFSDSIYVRKRAKEALRQSEGSRGLLLRAIADGIIGVDAGGQVTFVNPAALRMLGYSFVEMSGQNLHDLIQHSHQDVSRYPVEDNPLNASPTEATDGQGTDEVIRCKDGSSFPVEYSSTPIIMDSKVMGAVITFKDITERKQLEEKIRQIAAHDAATGLSRMKISVIYNSVSGKTQSVAEMIAEGARLGAEVEVRSMELDEVDVEFVKSSSAVILGCPTHSGVLSDQMEKWIETAGLDLDGKIGSVFATEISLGARADYAEIELVDRLLASGALVYSGRNIWVQPYTHYGAIVINDLDDYQGQRASRLGERVAKKAQELFRNG
jgi:NAD(P)H dehydrogenase (quinone)